MLNNAIQESFKETHRAMHELEKLLDGDQLPLRPAAGVLVEAERIKAAVAKLRRKIVAAANGSNGKAK